MNKETDLDPRVYGLEVAIPKEVWSIMSEFEDRNQMRSTQKTRHQLSSPDRVEATSEELDMEVILNEGCHVGLVGFASSLTGQVMIARLFNKFSLYPPSRSCFSSTALICRSKR